VSSQPTPGDILMAARRANHLAHCTDCRQRTDEAETSYAEFLAEYGASIQRRDRLTLGLRTARATGVAGGGEDR